MVCSNTMYVNHVMQMRALCYFVNGRDGQDSKEEDERKRRVCFLFPYCVCMYGKKNNTLWGIECSPVLECVCMCLRAYLCVCVMCVCLCV